MVERIAVLKTQGTATIGRRSAMAKACAEKLAACADLQDAAEEVAGRDAVAQEQQLGSSVTVAVQELTTLLGSSNPGWTQLAAFYGGRAEGCLVGHLQETAAGDGQVDAAAAHARILKTLEYRADNALDRPDVLRSIETARCRSFWPYAFAENAMDGSPVVARSNTHFSRKRRLQKGSSHMSAARTLAPPCAGYSTASCVVLRLRARDHADLHPSDHGRSPRTPSGRGP